LHIATLALPTVIQPSKVKTIKKKEINNNCRIKYNITWSVETAHSTLVSWRPNWKHRQKSTFRALNSWVYL